MNYSSMLKQKIKKNAIKLSSKKNISGRERESAYIFDKISMNFLEETFEKIKNNKEWEKRLQKTHSKFNDGTLEMQSSNSSDALLMNIFCHPRFKKWKGPAQLLGFDSKADFTFGWNPEFKNEKYPTEIDLKIGNHIFEAKLTEGSFTTKSKEVVRRYAYFKRVFDERLLSAPNGQIKHYQLIRNILASYKYKFKFTVLLDSSRVDLIRELLDLTKAIRISKIRNRISFFTWQELVDVCGNELKNYIPEKYF